MKRLVSVAACLMTLNLVGCCCMSASRIDECGPHATDLAGGGGCLAKFARSHGAKKKCGCQHCYGGIYSDPIYGMPYDVGGGCCGDGFDGGMMGGFPGMPSAGCGCGGGGGAVMPAPAPAYQPAPPAAQYAPEGSPTPAPMPTPDPNLPETNVPAVPGAETPAPPAPPMTYQPAPGQPGVQNVSVEEFQRLPGSIISGPTTTPVSAPAPAPVPGAMPSAAVAPAPAIRTRTPIPTIANPGVRPANWQPSRGY